MLASERMAMARGVFSGTGGVEIDCGVGFGLFAWHALRWRKEMSEWKGGWPIGRPVGDEHTHPPFLCAVFRLFVWPVLLAYSRAGRARDLAG